METRVNYVVVGLFVVGLGLAMILVAFWLASGEHRDYRKYLVYMNEAVSGLSTNAPVRFNGVDVGYVSNIDLNPSNPQQVRLLLSIDQTTPVNESTTAKLMAQGITGVTYIGLEAQAAQAPPLRVMPGNKYPIIKSTPSLLLELDTALREVTSNIKNVAQLLSRTFNDENQAAFARSLKNIETLSGSLANDSKEISQTIHNANKFLANAAKASDKFTSTLDSVDETARKLSQTGDKAIGVIQNVSQQALPSTIESLQRLSELLNNLEGLTNQIKDNPSLLIRGQHPDIPAPGE